MTPIAEDPGLETVSQREVVERIRALHPTTGSTRLVAIDGHGAAGKSTLARQIAEQLDGVTIVCLDDFGRPDAIGWDQQRFQDQILDPLLDGRPGRFQRWDWDTGRLAEWHDVPIDGTVIVEGVSSTRTELGTPWDLTIWVDAPEDVRLVRGVARDGEAMTEQWKTVWIPGENEYVANQRPQLRADLIVNGCEGAGL
jgi:uridine kinase